MTIWLDSFAIWSTKKDMTFTLNARIIYNWLVPVPAPKWLNSTQIKSSEDGYVCLNQAWLGLFGRGKNDDVIETESDGEGERYIKIE